MLIIIYNFVKKLGLQYFVAWIIIFFHKKSFRGYVSRISLLQVLENGVHNKHFSGIISSTIELRFIQVLYLQN